MDQATKALAFDLIRTGQASGACYVWQHAEDIAKLIKDWGQMEMLRITGQLAAIEAIHTINEFGMGRINEPITDPIETSALNVIRRSAGSEPADLPPLPGRYTEETIKAPGFYFFYPKHKLSGYERPHYVEIHEDALDGDLRCKKYAGVYVGPLIPPTKE